MLNPKGQKTVFDREMLHSGIINLNGAKVHWYILKEDRSGHGRDNVYGITALLHQGELFDVAINLHSKRINQFGIIMGAENIVIVVEPEGEYFQNIQRTSLRRVDGNQIPWHTWGEEFKQKMPSQVASYVKDLLTKSTENSHTDSITERLKKFEKFYKVSRYKPIKTGLCRVDLDSLINGTEGGRNRSSNSSSGSSTSRFNPDFPDINPTKVDIFADTIEKNRGEAGQNVEDLFASKIKDDGKPAKSISQNPFPKVAWVSVADKSRADGDELEDRAASYLEEENLIKANKDFQGIQDIIDHFSDQYKKIDEALPLVRGIVHEYIEQQLMESVAGALSMKNRKHWTNEHMKILTSPEALTACTMQRVHIVTEINRALKNKLGKSVGNI